MPYQQSPKLSSGYLVVSDGHELYYEERGNQNGIPIIFLHGGPGGAISELSWTFFDPEKYRVILFDQRGTGKSRPFLHLENNNVMASAEDIEALRKHFAIERWAIFGGSYGTTLALYYAIHYPDRVTHMTLRGIFLGRQSDIDWLYEGGAGQVFPHTFAKFKAMIPKDEQDNLVKAYTKRFVNEHNQARGRLGIERTSEEVKALAKVWADWETSCCLHLPKALSQGQTQAGDLTIATLEAYYFNNHMSWGSDNYLLEHADKLSQLPIDVFHGRYDMVCLLGQAYDLKNALGGLCQLYVVEAGGHSPYEEPFYSILVHHFDLLAKTLS